jgi:hypothetical protein
MEVQGVLSEYDLDAIHPTLRLWECGERESHTLVLSSWYGVGLLCQLP